MGAIERFLGGSIGSVILKLLVISLLIGAFLWFLGVDPAQFWRGIRDLADQILQRGWDALGDVGIWILWGAAIVVPVFLIWRVLQVLRGRA